MILHQQSSIIQRSLFKVARRPELATNCARGLRSMSIPLKYVDPIHLACQLREQAANKQRTWLVLDVRDEDFRGGHIKGAINMPSEQFYSDEAVDELIAKQLTGTGIEQVVVHCMFSMQRGPRCAGKLAKRLEAAGRINQPSVAVLRGGWEAFWRTYYQDTDLLDGTEVPSRDEQ